MIVSKAVRIRGWLLIILGACVSVGMAISAAFLALTIAHNDQLGGTHWTGSHEMRIKTFEPAFYWPIMRQQQRNSFSSVAYQA